MADDRLKNLRGSSRRDFLKWGSAVGALLGLERTRFLDALSDTAGTAMADLAACATTSKSVHLVGGSGGIPWAHLLWPHPEVALASGFNSVRRFNETFLEMFGRPPASLRHSRDKTRRDAGELSVRLAYRPPYDWDAMLSFLGARAIPGVETVSGNLYRRTIAIGGHSGIISVAPAEKNRNSSGSNMIAVTAPSWSFAGSPGSNSSAA